MASNIPTVGDEELPAIVAGTPFGGNGTKKYRNRTEYFAVIRQTLADCRDSVQGIEGSFYIAPLTYARAMDFVALMERLRITPLPLLLPTEDSFTFTWDLEYSKFWVTVEGVERLTSSLLQLPEIEWVSYMEMNNVTQERWHDQPNDHKLEDLQARLDHPFFLEGWYPIDTAPREEGRRIQTRETDSPYRKRIMLFKNGDWFVHDPQGGILLPYRPTQWQKEIRLVGSDSTTSSTPEI